jgi:hypothetical protein
LVVAYEDCHGVVARRAQLDADLQAQLGSNKENTK